MIAISNYLTFSAILFGISVAGIFINRKNLIILLMCIELMLLSINTNFIIPMPKRNSFRMSKKLSGGCLMDMGPYAAATARLLGSGKLLKMHTN